MGNDVIHTKRCQNCGRLVSIRKGETIQFEIKSSWLKGRLFPDSPARVYLCLKCSDKVTDFQKYDWYESHKFV